MKQMSPEDLTKFTTRMVEVIGDMTNHEKIAEWAVGFAIRSYRDGYKDGSFEIMKLMLADALERDIADGSDISAEFLKRYAGGGRGAPRTGPGPTSEGGAGVSTGEGGEARTGAQHGDASAGDGLRVSGEGIDPARPGDAQGGGVSGEVRDAQG